MWILILFLILSIPACSNNSFYLGKFFPKPHYYNKHDEYMDVKIIKSQKWQIGEIEGEVYEGDTIEVTCYGFTDNKIKLQDLYIEKRNSTRKLVYSRSYVDERTVIKYSDVVDRFDSGEYTCVFSPDHNPRTQKQLVNVIRIQTPNAIVYALKKRTFEYGKTGQLECEVEEGVPPPVYKWTKNMISVGKSRILTVENVKESDSGTYNCSATNRAGSGHFSVEVNVVGIGNATRFIQNDSPRLSFDSLLIILLLLVVMLILSIHLCRESGFSNDDSSTSTFPPNFRIELENLKISEKIGDGNFGNVHSGFFNMENKSPINVAIKSPKNVGDIFQIGMLKEEYEIMKEIRLHPNILTLIGSVHGSNNTTISHIVFELCELGSLCDYLRLRKYHTPYLMNQNDSDLEANTVWNDHDEMLAEQLSFAYQIAKGMEFLASVKCIHRDLAARNVLLKSNKVCRIADFGLTRLHENKDYYRTRYQTEVPVRWMSIESITEGKYTEKSDVWAFGIVLFEIFSLGEKPYPSVESDDIVRYILDGNVNDKPDKCHPRVYAMMKKYWQKDPKKRPNFSDCSKFFNKCIKYNFPEMHISLQNLEESEAAKQRCIGNTLCE